MLWMRKSFLSAACADLYILENLLPISKGLMEQLQKACEAGERILVSRQNFNSEMASLMKQHAYFWIIDEEEEEENGMMGFVQAVITEDLEMALELLNLLSKSVVVTESVKGRISLATDEEGMYKAVEADEVLKKERTVLYYVQPLRVFYRRRLPVFFAMLNASAAAFIPHRRQASQALPQALPGPPVYPLAGRFAVYPQAGWFNRRSEEEIRRRFEEVEEEIGWRPLDVVHEDTSNWIEGHSLQLPEPLSGQQKISASFLLELHIKKGERRAKVKVQTKVLRAAVPRSEFVEEGLSMGYFPDKMKLSITPSCQCVAVVEPKIITCDSRVLTHTTNIGGQIGYSPIAQFTFGRMMQSLPQRHSLSLVNEGQPGNVTTFEWRLLRWKDDRKYKGLLKTTALGRPPQLPYNGTGPILQEDKFPCISWSVSTEDIKYLSLQVDLQVNMQFLKYTDYGLFSTLKLHPQSWSLSKSYPIYMDSTSAGDPMNNSSTNVNV